MTDMKLRELAEAAAGLLRPHLERSASLRKIVGLLGEWLIEESRLAGDEGEKSASAQAVEQRPDVQPPQAQTSGRIDSPADRSAARTLSPTPRTDVSSATLRLNIGGIQVPVSVQDTRTEIARAQAASAAAAQESRSESRGDQDDRYPDRGGELDLELVEKRCRLKAESCKLYLERRAVVGDPLYERPLESTIIGLIATAKSLPDCFLWVLFRERTQPSDDKVQIIGRCYLALAESVSVVGQLSASKESVNRDLWEKALDLLAESSTMLYKAMRVTWLTSPDHDQAAMNIWLFQEAKRRRIYLQSYSAVDIFSEPGRADDLIQRAEAIKAGLVRQQTYARQIEGLFKRIGYHARQLAESQGDDAAHHLGKITDAINELVGIGVTPDDRRVAQAIGDKLGRAFQDDESLDARLAQAMQAAASLPAADGADDSASSDDSASWSQQVIQVREWLRGRSIVMVGGERRNDAIERLKSAFELDDVNWVQLTEHGSGEPMRAPIARPDTALVVVLIRLTGHLFTDQACEFARAAEKPFVLMKAGYNPEQIAEAVVQQASDQLKRVPS